MAEVSENCVNGIDDDCDGVADNGCGLFSISAPCVENADCASGFCDATGTGTCANAPTVTGQWEIPSPLTYTCDAGSYSISETGVQINDLGGGAMELQFGSNPPGTVPGTFFWPGRLQRHLDRRRCLQCDV